MERIRGINNDPSKPKTILNRFHRLTSMKPFPYFVCFPIAPIAEDALMCNTWTLICWKAISNGLHDAFTEHSKFYSRCVCFFSLSLLSRYVYFHSFLILFIDVSLRSILNVYGFVHSHSIISDDIFIQIEIKILTEQTS